MLSVHNNLIPRSALKRVGDPHKNLPKALQDKKQIDRVLDMVVRLNDGKNDLAGDDKNLVVLQDAKPGIFAGKKRLSGTAELDETGVKTMKVRLTDSDGRDRHLSASTNQDGTKTVSISNGNNGTTILSLNKNGVLTEMSDVTDSFGLYPGAVETTNFGTDLSALSSRSKSDRTEPKKAGLLDKLSMKNLSLEEKIATTGLASAAVLGGVSALALVGACFALPFAGAVAVVAGCCALPAAAAGTATAYLIDDSSNSGQNTNSGNHYQQAQSRRRF